MIVQLSFEEDYLNAHKIQIERGEYDIPRDCRLCKATSSVIGHGIRERTCIGPDTDVIFVRRGKCKSCRTTFTFLPAFARPYSRYAVVLIQNTILNFISNNENTVFRSIPNLKKIAWWPDMKTPYNWLHIILERLENSVITFASPPNRIVTTFKMPEANIFLLKVTPSASALYKRLFSGLIALKEKFDVGLCIHDQGLCFDASNFFQSLLSSRFPAAVVLTPYFQIYAHHCFHDHS